MLAQEANSIQPETQSQIGILLGNELKQLERLREILESEKEALGNHDAQFIEDIVTEKKTAVSAVEKASVQRMNFVKSLGINPLSENWFEQTMLGLGDAKVLLEKFDYLISLTSRCRALNQMNGLLINRRELLTSKVINILRANSSPEIYSNNGYSESSSDTRMLGKA